MAANLRFAAHASTAPSQLARSATTVHRSAKQLVPSGHFRVSKHHALVLNSSNHELACQDQVHTDGQSPATPCAWYSTTSLPRLLQRGAMGVSASAVPRRVACSKVAYIGATFGRVAAESSGHRAIGFQSNRSMASQPSRPPVSIKRVLSMCKGPEELSQHIILNMEVLDYSAVSTAFYKMAGHGEQFRSDVSLSRQGVAPEAMKIAIDQLSLRALFFMENREVEPPDLARILWALGRMGPSLWPESVAQLMEALIVKVEASAHAFTPREIAETFQALQDMPWLAEERALRALCKQGSNVAQNFSPTLIATTLAGMHKLRIGEHEHMLQAICRKGVTLAQGFQPHLIAMTLRALADIKIRQHRKEIETPEDRERVHTPTTPTLPADLLVQVLCKRTSGTVRKFEAGDVGSTLRSLSDLRVAADDPTVEALRQHCIAKREGFTPQAIADALVGLAALRTGGEGGDGSEGNDEAIKAMVSEAVAKMQQFKPPQIADTLVAVAAMGADAEKSELVQRLLQRVEEGVEEFQARDIAATLGALAELKVEVSDATTAGLCARAMQVRGALGPEEIVQVLWGLQELGVSPDREFLVDMSEQATAKAMAFDAESIGEMLGVLAHMGEGAVGPDALRALSLRAAVLSEQLEAPHLVNVLASLLLLSSQVELPAEASIARALSCRAGELLWELSEEECCVAARALAALCARAGVAADGAVLEGLAQRIEPRAGEAGAADVAMLLRSFADLGLKESKKQLGVIAALMARAVELRGAMGVVELSQSIAALEDVGADIDPRLLDAYTDLLAGEDRAVGGRTRKYME